MEAWAKVNRYEDLCEENNLSQMVMTSLWRNDDVML